MNYIKCYITLKESFSMSNMREALISIGERDPMNVKRFYLLESINRFHMVLCHRAINKNDYLRRGILNVRKKINCNLGLCGEFSNRMINLMLFPDSSHNKYFHETHSYSIKVRYKKYIKIVKVIYELLILCNKEKAEELFNMALYDPELSRLLRSPIHKLYKTVAPMQTHTVLINRDNTNDDVVLKNLHKKIEEDVDDAEPSK